MGIRRADEATSDNYAKRNNFFHFKKLLTCFCYEKN